MMPSNSLQRAGLYADSLVEEIYLDNNKSSTTLLHMAKSRSKMVKTPTQDPKVVDDLIRVIWMGLGGRSADLSRYLQRVLPNWKSSQPELAERALKLLEQSTPTAGPVRRAPDFSQSQSESTMEAVPKSNDINTVEFLRIEDDITLDVEPVWPSVVQESLNSMVKERRFSKRLLDAGLAPTRTTIFTGPPGVGKTLAARWLAREMKLPLCILNLGSVMSSFLGRTGANLRNAMSYASSNPCIMFLDEIDAIAKKRDDSTDIGELKRLVTVLLQELDAWPSNNLLIAATNHEQLIDAAVWRRFERRIRFPMPDPEQQSGILEQMLGANWKNLDALKRDEIAIATMILSPSDLTQLALRSRRDAVLSDQPFFDCIAANVQRVMQDASLDQKRNIAEILKKRGVSQREIHRITGLARETIRRERH